jgi:SAM-dependent methyltransferase
VINICGVLEYLEKPSKIIKEIHRVLAHGGWAFITVPSTDGRGAWKDPDFQSFYNQNTFEYYTKANKSHSMMHKNVRFASMRNETLWSGEKMATVKTHLIALKNDSVRYPGLIEI